MAERVAEAIDQNAAYVAELTHCQVTSGWVTRMRVGLANHAMAEITYRNLELTGPPVFGDEAKAFGREIQQNLGLVPMDEPIMKGIDELTPPKKFEATVREVLPPGH